MKPLVVIPARGGSKGVSGKNIKPLNGKPLIYYTIDVAREIFQDFQIIVSTDSPQIKNVVEETGLEVPFLRPARLATDTASTRDVLIHALSFYNKKNPETDVVVLLQPTSPFRKKKHVLEALALYRDNLDMVVSVKESKANPYFNLFEENSDGFLTKSKPGNFVRRQDCPKVWEYNGALYVINTKSLKKKQISQFKHVKKYVMDEVSSIDIDTQEDFLYCEFILSHAEGK